MLSGSSRMMLTVGLLIGLAGCYSDRPHDYGKERPPVDQLDERDKGLQSKDVISASEKMAMDLLAAPELNASHTRWTMVVDKMEDHTADHEFSRNFDIFLERLRVKLSQEGHDRVALIENKARFHDLRSRELESERDDAPAAANAPAPKPVVQPDYALYGKAIDMPNRATNFYQLQFDVVNLQTREQVWSRVYEVKVAR
jgi:hypothetical protein